LSFVSVLTKSSDDDKNRSKFKGVGVGRKDLPFSLEAIFNYLKNTIMSFFSAFSGSKPGNSNRGRQIESLKANFHELKAVQGDDSSYYLPVQAAVVAHKEPEFMRLQIHLPHDFPERSGPILFFPPTPPNRAQILHKLVDSKTGMVISSDSISKWNDMSNLGSYVQSVLEQFTFPFEQPRFSGTSTSSNASVGGGGGGGALNTANASSAMKTNGANLTNHAYLSAPSQQQQQQQTGFNQYQIPQSGASSRGTASNQSMNNTGSTSFPSLSSSSSSSSSSPSPSSVSSASSQSQQQKQQQTPSRPLRSKTIVPPIPVSFPQLASIELSGLQELHISEEKRETLLDELSSIHEMRSTLSSAQSRLKRAAEANIALERQIQEQAEMLEAAKRKAQASSDTLNELVARQLDVQSHFNPDPLKHSLEATADELEKRSEDAASNLSAVVGGGGSGALKLRDTLKEIESLRTRMHLARIKALVISQHGIVN
jgi:hypothetical protein